MAELRGIKWSLFLMLLLQFTAMGQSDDITVRVGDDVTLSCESLMEGQNNCDSTTWIFSVKTATPAVLLVTRGQIGRRAGAKSDRLSVTKNCSLGIKNVTEEDAGHYGCRQIRSGQLIDSVVDLYVVKMTEQKDADDDEDEDDDDEVTLRCSVSIYDRCRHKVKWLLQGQTVDKNNPELKPSQSECSASVTFPASDFGYTSRNNSFTCGVTSDFTRKVKLFPFSPQPAGKKPGKGTTTTTTTTTTAGDNHAPPNLSAMWVYVIVAAVLVALLIIAVAVISWKRTKGNKTRMSDKLGLTSNPAGTLSAPKTNQGKADPEDGISYASISYTRNTNSKAQIRRKTDDDAVMYSTVKASPADPGNLYATLN